MPIAVVLRRIILITLLVLLQRYWLGRGWQLATGLTSRAASINSVTALFGFAPETRPLHPHITLARAKGRGRSQPLRALQQRIHLQPTFTRFSANEFLLYEGHLFPTGSIYEVRHRFPLGSTARSTP
jgi:2'-5' RNA ligase